MGLIRHLEPHLINQIAAGEVVERPASVVKELLENALDAGALSITIVIRKGGQSLIRVEDNGMGMSKEDLLLAVQRHTTSKIKDADLSRIATFGFRGEALATIASVARLTIGSHVSSQPHGWSLFIEGGNAHPPQPIALAQGTFVEVADLFFATPARLKFMRSGAVEQGHIINIIEKIALAHPDIAFHVQQENRKKTYPMGLTERIRAFLGADFMEHSFPICEEKDGYKMTGYVGAPAYHHPNQERQLFFVNGRPVRDRHILFCVKTAFSEVMSAHRHPALLLFLHIPSQDLDVNVHPAKTEVRFRDLAFFRSFLMTGLKKNLFARHNAHVIVAQETAPIPPSDHRLPYAFPAHMTLSPVEGQTVSESGSHRPWPSFFSEKYEKDNPPLSLQESPWTPKIAAPYLGQALGQIFQSYIVACNDVGLVLVDPHAAHERIVYEKMKVYWADRVGHVQPFLLAISLEFTAAERELLQHYQSLLSQLGFCYKIDETCDLYSLPAIFKAYDPKTLLSDLLAILRDGDTAESVLHQWRNHMMKNWACKQSIKLGQSLSLPEMNALLREIEKTPHGAQCNHGRPVYKQFSMKEMAAFFERL